MIKMLMVTAIASVSLSVAHAEEDHGMMEACKVECPQAKSEHESHQCMEGIVQKKKSDKKFRKSDCYAAFKEHEKHEKEDGHKH